jgi:hypothetical protein
VYEAGAGRIEFISRQLLPTLWCCEVDCQVKIFCAACANSGDQMDR